MRWPWRRERREVDPEPAADARPDSLAAPTRPAWRDLAPLKRVAADDHTTSDTVGFVTTLPTRWRVAPALQPLRHDVSVAAPTGRVAVADVAAGGYPEPPELVWPTVDDAGGHDEQDQHVERWAAPMRRSMTDGLREQSGDLELSSSQSYRATDGRGEMVDRVLDVHAGLAGRAGDVEPVGHERPVVGERPALTERLDHNEATTPLTKAMPTARANTDAGRGDDSDVRANLSAIRPLEPRTERLPLSGPEPEPENPSAAVDHAAIDKAEPDRAVTLAPPDMRSSKTIETPAQADVSTRRADPAGPVSIEARPHRPLVGETQPLAVARPALHLPGADSGSADRGPADLSSPKSSAADMREISPSAVTADQQAQGPAPEAADGLGVPSWFTGLSVTAPDAAASHRVARTRPDASEPGATNHETVAPEQNQAWSASDDDDLPAVRRLDAARPRRVPWPMALPDDVSHKGSGDDDLPIDAMPDAGELPDLVLPDVFDTDNVFSPDPVPDSGAATARPADFMTTEPVREIAEPPSDPSGSRRVFRVGPPLPPPARPPGPPRDDPPQRGRGLEALAAAAGLPDAPMAESLSSPWGDVGPAPWAAHQPPQVPGAEPDAQRPSPTASPSAPETAHQPKAAPTADEVYEQVRSRIRQELLVDRERSSMLADP